MPRIAESFDAEKEEEEERQRAEIESSIEEAKWNMYAKRWDKAEDHLQNAISSAITLRDKKKIDELLSLLAKCEKNESVEV